MSLSVTRLDTNASWTLGAHTEMSTDTFQVGNGNSVHWQTIECTDTYETRTEGYLIGSVS
jgi:hypothetical protein